MSRIKEIANEFNLTKSDFWELKRGSKTAWILTHDACEKIAYQKGIVFKKPDIYRDNNSNIAFVGEGVLKDRTEWTTGEANPTNCKMAYNWAMAEKRLKDRLTLKLINAYEHGIYSEVEADSFKKDNSSSLEPSPMTKKQQNLIMQLELTAKVKNPINFEGLDKLKASEYIDKLNARIDENVSPNHR